MQTIYTLRNLQITPGVQTSTFQMSRTPATPARPNAFEAKQWDDIMFETSVDVFEEYLDFLKRTSDNDELQEHLSYMMSD